MRLIGLAVVLVLSLVFASLAAEAQEAGKVWTIGWMESGRAGGASLDAFRDGLRELGYIEGRNLHIEGRFANNESNLLSNLAADLVRLRVAVIVAGDSEAVVPAMEATTSIPIVMTVSGDPVDMGWVASLAHPGGNVTGLANMGPALTGKRLQLLGEALPRFARVAVLGVPKSNLSIWRVLPAATDALSLKLQRLEVNTRDDFEHAFEAATAGRADGVLVLPSPVTNRNARRLVRLAAERRLPAMYPLRQYADVGGLMAYGPNIPDLSRRAATYVDKILKGAKPADLPVEQPTKFELVVNLKTAKTLRLTIPQSVLVRADQVIE